MHTHRDLALEFENTSPASLIEMVMFPRYESYQLLSSKVWTKAAQKYTLTGCIGAGFQGKTLKLQPFVYFSPF